MERVNPKKSTLVPSSEGTNRTGLSVSPFGKKTTLQCLNIKGSVLSSNRVKVETLEDKLE